MAKAKKVSSQEIVREIVREKVIGITITVLTSDGNCKTITIDPSRTEALFWSDRAVNEILAPFYDRIDKETTQEELVSRFGERIMPVLKTLGMTKESVKITPSLIQEMWNLTNKNGDGIGYIEKTRKCIPRPSTDF